MLVSGIDLVEIKRIEKSLENNSFLPRFFGDEEIEYFKKKNMPAQSIAASFAAKEAFSKAVGTGLSGFALKEVQLLREDSGKPYLVFSGKALELSKNYQWSVSISHTETLATAMIVGLKTNES